MRSLFKRRTKKHDDSVTGAEQPWENCIAVCTKCARKARAMDGDKTKLRVGLKALIGLRGLKKKVRPVDVSCLDVCPDDKIIVAHMTPTGTTLKQVGPGVKPEQVLREFGY